MYKLKLGYLVFAGLGLAFCLHYGDYQGAMLITVMGFIVAGS